MSDLDLEAIKAMLAKATPGPWTIHSPESAPVDRPALQIRGTRATDRSRTTRPDLRNAAPISQKVAYVFTPTEPVGCLGGQKCTKRTLVEGEANAELIANAPIDLAALVAEVERLRDELSKTVPN